MNRGPNLTLRLWDPRDGDPGQPARVLGIPVDHLLAWRVDAPGALVVLEDRRLALTGVLAAVGRHRFLRAYVRERARSKPDQAYRAWLAEVSAALDRMQPESRARGTRYEVSARRYDRSAPESRDGNRDTPVPDR